MYYTYLNWYLSRTVKIISIEKDGCTTVQINFLTSNKRFIFLKLDFCCQIFIHLTVKDSNRKGTRVSSAHNAPPVYGNFDRLDLIAMAGNVTWTRWYRKWCTRLAFTATWWAVPRPCNLITSDNHNSISTSQSQSFKLSLHLLHQLYQLDKWIWLLMMLNRVQMARIPKWSL